MPQLRTGKITQAPKSPRAKPRKAPSKKVAVDPPREEVAVPTPPTEKPVLVREDPEAGKYAKKEKVGTPKLGRSTNYVETVGLGKLQVVHAETPTFPYNENA